MQRVMVVLSLAWLTVPAFAGNSNSLLDISADGKLLACSNRDNGTVTIVRLPSLEKLGEIPVGAHPEGVSFVGDSHTLACAVYAEDVVRIADADQLKVLASVEVFDEPYGIVSTADGERLYVTLDYPGRIVEISTANRSVLRQFDAGDFVRGIALSPDESRLYVTEYYTALVRAIDRESGEAVDEWPAASTDNLARQLAIHPSGTRLFVPHIRSRVRAAHGNGSIFPYVTLVDTVGEGKRRTRIPMDAFRGARVVANPWEVAVAPTLNKLFVIFGATDDLYICEMAPDRLEDAGALAVGHNPRAVRVSPDERTLYVYNALDFEVTAWDTERYRKVGQVQVCDVPYSAAHHQGKILFYTAKQPMSGRQWISCSSCHPDGQPDGRTWQNPEGLRNTQSLAGLAWTHPIHWSSDRDEVQDFEHTIRGPLMQGRGLLRGRLPEQLGEKITGQAEALDALATYANSHKFSLSPYARDGLSEAAQRGRTIFQSAETGCTQCHRGPLYTDSLSGRDVPRHDVGTGLSDPTEKMGPKFDTPTLLGVYRSAPYLHHGEAATLTDVLTTANAGDRHGHTSQLSSEEVADLVAFLKALPYEDPLTAAQASGVTPVTATDKSADAKIKLESGTWKDVKAHVAAQRGKVVIVDIWSTSCVPCMREFPELVKLHQQYGKKISCVSFNVDYYGAKDRPPSHYEDRVKKFLTSRKATFRNFLSETASDDLFDELELGSIPAVYVFGPDGKLARRFDELDFEDGEDDPFTYKQDIVPLVRKLMAAQGDRK